MPWGQSKLLVLALSTSKRNCRFGHKTRGPVATILFDILFAWERLLMTSPVYGWREASVTY